MFDKMEELQQMKKVKREGKRASGSELTYLYDRSSGRLQLVERTSNMW